MNSESTFVRRLELFEKRAWQERLEAATFIVEKVSVGENEKLERSPNIIVVTKSTTVTPFLQDS